MQQTPLTSPSIFTQAAEWALSAVGGAFLVFVAFRTRLALMDRRIQSRKTEIEELEKSVMQRLDTIDRRQALVLEIVADIARKVGVDSRFSDAVVRFLSEEARGRTRERERDVTGEMDAGAP